MTKSLVDGQMDEWTLNEFDILISFHLICARCLDSKMPWRNFLNLNYYII